MARLSDSSLARVMGSFLACPALSWLFTQTSVMFAVLIDGRGVNSSWSSGSWLAQSFTCSSNSLIFCSMRCLGGGFIVRIASRSFRCKSISCQRSRLARFVSSFGVL